MRPFLPVSIPFKRETAFKREYRVLHEKRRTWFQFPSNGKLHSNFPQQQSQSQFSWLVSIPFKRETAFKLSPTESPTQAPCQVSIPFKRETAFKQPMLPRVTAGNRVSIPFKRETAFKLVCYLLHCLLSLLVVSIPFKRETAFKLVKYNYTARKRTNLVSIPFKRETAFKRGNRQIFWLLNAGSFNSLQTGNCIQTLQ